MLIYPRAEDFLRQAMLLAAHGRGLVEPNPMVGCTIVRDGQLIGAGRHQIYGAPHAEREALSDCNADPAGATAYVTLEPCCHTDKRTPPCVPALIGAKLARVVVGCLDPNPKVNGAGVAQLRAAGIAVQAPALDGPCRQLIAPFFARIVHARPYVTLKWAQSADGKIAGPSGRRVRIGGTAATAQVHALRARCDGILVGINTALNDDPMLISRHPGGGRPLLRIVMDGNLRLPPEGTLARTARAIRTRVYCRAAAADGPRAGALSAVGVEVVGLPEDATGHPSISAMLAHIGREPITHLLVEPGPTLADAFLAHNAVDRLWVFSCARRIDDPTAPGAPMVPDDFVRTGEISVGEDRLCEYLNPRSAVYFAAEESADLHLASAAH